MSETNRSTDPQPSRPAASPATSLDDGEGLPTPRRYIAVAAALMGILIAVLDGAIANIALPTLSQDLQISPAASIWVVSSYQLAMVATLFPLALMGESLGYRRIFLGGVALFTVASLACALSHSLLLLVLARTVQGVGSAGLFATLAALLRFTYPRRIYGSAIGLNAMVVGLGAAAGPSLGAFILSIASWPWLFAVNVPIGILILLAGPALPKAPTAVRHIDPISAVLNALFFCLLVSGVDQLLASPWLAGAMLVVAAISGWLLVRREAPRKAPLVPLDLLRSPIFSLSVISSICSFGAQMLAYVALPFYLQHTLALDTLTSGAAMMPWPLGVALCAPFAGLLSNRISTGMLCACGGMVLAIGLLLLAILPFHGASLPFIVLMLACGCGFGFFQTPNNRNMLLSAPRARVGAAGGMQSAARQVGQCLGAALLALLFTAAPNHPRAGLGVAALLALISAIASLARRKQPELAAD